MSLRHFTSAAALALFGGSALLGQEVRFEITPEVPTAGDDLVVAVSYDVYCPVETTSTLDGRTLRVVTRDLACLCLAPAPTGVDHETVIPAVTPGEWRIEVRLESDSLDCQAGPPIGERAIEVTTPWERSITVEPALPRQGDEVTLRIEQPCDASWALELEATRGRTIALTRTPTPGVPPDCDPSIDPPEVEERSLGALVAGIWRVEVTTLDDPGSTTEFTFTVLPAWERSVGLRDGRFRVRAAWNATGHSPPDGRALGAADPDSDESASFWFFRPENRELFVKVLDGCAINDHYWVFATGLTDVGVDLRVEDAETAAQWSARTEPGEPFPPVLDVEALPCASHSM